MRINPNQLMELSSTDDFIDGNAELIEQYLKSINMRKYATTEDEDEQTRILHSMMMEALQAYYDSLINMKNPNFNFNQRTVLNLEKFQDKHKDTVKQYFDLWQEIAQMEKSYHRTHLKGLVSKEYKNKIQELKAIVVTLKTQINNFHI